MLQAHLRVDPARIAGESRAARHWSWLENLLRDLRHAAGLLLARASAREQEFPIRLSIGAEPGLPDRQLLAESLLLSALGTAAGPALRVERVFDFVTRAAGDNNAPHILSRSGLIFANPAHIAGDTSRPEVWNELTKLRNETFPSEIGAMFPINCLAIDSGCATTEVYEWARKQGNNVLVVKGDVHAEGVLGAASPVDVGPRGMKSKYGIKVWPVNSGMAKEELYRWLKLDRPTDEDLEKGIAFPPGYCHFPKYSDEYFKQLTAEQLVTKTVKGYRRTEWQKMRERNESLDCRVYARAAASRLGIDRFQGHHWQTIEEDWKASIEQERLRQLRSPGSEQQQRQPSACSWKSKTSSQSGPSAFCKARRLS